MEAIVGIDYGSKLAGTTVIAFYHHGIVRFAASKHQQDADKFIAEQISIMAPTYVFLDAPLSLPGRYFNSENYSDYFYREADRLLGAMSPMFIGGLTARAMKLRDYLHSTGVNVFETYPNRQAQIVEVDMQKYKKDEKNIVELASNVAIKFDLQVNYDQMSTWHHFDAFLAYITGLKYLRQEHQEIGDAEEGLILI
jgi:predicted nuclease with RNAse H fold